MKGALNWLLSDAESSKMLRQKATFLFAPALDPDGLSRCMYENICYTFVSRYHVSDHTPSSTSNAYVRWFRSWANEGKRLDVIINQHAVESGETSSHLFNYVVEPEYHRHDTNMAYWKHAMKRVREAGFRVDETPSNKGNVYDRLAGFLNRYMQTMQLFVELNTQPKIPGRKLTLYEIEQLGRQLVRSTVEFLYSSKAVPLYRSIRKKRNNRRKLVERYEPYMQIFREADNPLERESWMWVLPNYERAYRVWKESSGSAEVSLKCEDWFRDLYRQSDVCSKPVPHIP
jgi:hypothetical protein